MIFDGRILKIFPTQSGTGKDGKQWQRQDFVFEYFEQPDDRWSDKVVLSLLGDNIARHNIAEGDEVRCGFGHGWREYEGRPYNELRLYRFEKLATASGNAPQSPETRPTGNSQSQSETTRQAAKDGDDLPF